MLVVFVHGWSVTNTETYGGLPSAVVKNASSVLDLTVKHLYLAKYVSFSDEVTIDDIARGMHAAVAAEIVPILSRGERFACITHSTGGPVVRKWIELFYKDALARCPLRHLVMLAPPNHGSALAQLGKGRLARMKFFVEGVQPGKRVLDWLELGSYQSWELNVSWLQYDCVQAGLFPFVLIGQTIDRRAYDNLNTYTGEAGSDGVVRVAAANLNYGMIRLLQKDGGFVLQKTGRTPRTAFGVLPGRSHSGDNMGIMQSVAPDDDGSHPTVKWVLRCLGVDDPVSYGRLVRQLRELTTATQDAEEELVTKELFLVRRKFITHRYCMFVFRIVDDRGNELIDYDVILTAGPRYDANHLPEGFFVDRQRNQNSPGKLTYYVDYDVMQLGLAEPALQSRIGFRIGARPAQGYAYYAVAEYQGTLAMLNRYFEANQTLMIEIQLARHVMEGVFRLTQDLNSVDFSRQPRGTEIP